MFFLFFSGSVWFGLAVMIFLSGSEQNAVKNGTRSVENRQHQFTSSSSSNCIAFLVSALVCVWKERKGNTELEERERESPGNYVEPKIHGFKWKDNGSWAALCHYLTHSIRAWFWKRWSTFPCFQLVQNRSFSYPTPFTASFLAMLHEYALHVGLENAFSMMIMSFRIIITEYIYVCIHVCMFRIRMW